MVRGQLLRFPRQEGGVAILFNLQKPVLYAHVQSSTMIRSLVDSDANRGRGLIYLQDEQYTFSTKEGGREWSVYGSPASRYASQPT